MSNDPMALPADLPVPEDDGAADHLRGAALPAVPLPATDGSTVDLSALLGRTIVYASPRTGEPGRPALVDDWDSIPGARGCTPESCGFRDHHAELAALGARVFGLSTQDTDYQQRAVDNLSLPVPLLSDAGLALVQAASLPTFDAAGQTLLKRLTLVIDDGVVTHLWYPVFPPDRHAEDVLAWLREQGQEG
jgi:peroxiredoxin (alkyl hydroperoxide reductase subunit C)